MSETRETRVVAVLDDIFFASKIKEAAKSSGVRLDFIKNANGFIENMDELSSELLNKGISFSEVSNGAVNMTELVAKLITLGDNLTD